MNYIKMLKFHRNKEKKLLKKINELNSIIENQKNTILFLNYQILELKDKLFECRKENIFYKEEITYLKGEKNGN